VSDAFVARRLREAGCIIVAKVNLSEWAASGGSVSTVTDVEVLKAGAVPNGFSSQGGRTRNPHDLTRGPSTSSGGTGAAIAAAFAQFGLGTDTGGSIRGPSSANGIVGLKTTHGLVQPRRDRPAGPHPRHLRADGPQRDRHRRRPRHLGGTRPER
jgi:amidase